MSEKNKVGLHELIGKLEERGFVVLNEEEYQKVYPVLHEKKLITAEEKQKLELVKANIKSVIAILETAAEMDSKEDIMAGMNEAIRLLKDIDKL